MPAIPVTNNPNPGGRAFTITKSDSEDCEYVTRAIILGDGDGTLSFINLEGQIQNWSGLALGVEHSIRTTRVRETGTASTQIFGLA